MWLWLACAPTPDAPDPWTPLDTAHTDVAGRFWPEAIQQGTRVPFDLYGRDTHWKTGDKPRFFFADGGEDNGLFLTGIEVVDEEHLRGDLYVERAAWVGPRDVQVGDVRVADAFTVTASPEPELPLSSVHVVTQLDVEHQIDPDTCAVRTKVTALVAFVVPDGCGGSPPPSQSPAPFDREGIFALPPDEASSCPTDETLDVGDVWFESATDVLPLERVVGGTGQITYQGVTLGAEDYHLDRLYDLVWTGDPATLPGFRVPAQQPTVPVATAWTGPDLCHRVHDRATPFAFTWDSEGTYPDATLGVALEGTLEATQVPGYVGVIPWDDGAYALAPEHLRQLATGPARLVFQTYVEGPIRERDAFEADFVLGPDDTQLFITRGTSRVRTIGELALR